MQNKLKIQLAIFGLFFLVFNMLLQSCKKDSMVYSGFKDTREKFYIHSDQTNKIILGVIEEIKRRDNKGNFVSQFAISNGYPNWDESIISFPEKTSPLKDGDITSNLEEPSKDTFAYIPLVLENSDRVNGYILAKVNNGIELLYSLAQDYKAFNFENGESFNDATKFVITNLLLNKKVFGISDYKITDYRLFNSDSLHEKLLTLDAVLTAANCILIYWPSGQYSSNGEPIISSVEFCISPDGVNWPPGGIGISSSGGGVSGGGGGGSGIPHYYPCNSGGTTSTTPQCPEPGPGSGWIPHPNISSTIIPCEVLEQAAKKLDSLYIKSKVDSMLQLLPSGWQVDSTEYGFPLYKKFQGVAQQPGHFIVTDYFPGSVQTGTVGNIAITFDIRYNTNPTGTAHIHTSSAYPAQSASDIYQLIISDTTFHHPDPNIKYEGNFVIAYDSSKYGITITNDSLAHAFLNTRDQYLDGDKWKENTSVGKAFKEAFEYFRDNDSTKSNYAYEKALAAVLSQFNTGVTLYKKVASGNFKPIVVNTIIPNPNKPKKKQYVLDCL